MKKTITLLAIVAMSFNANATVHTVSSNPINAGQYTNVQTCINASTAGDTIYVTGSPYDYGSITVDRKLTFIGAGYDVTGTQNNLGSEVDNVTLSNNVTYATDATGSSFIGLYINGSFNNNSGAYANIYIGRCFMGTYVNVTANGWIIENNVISSGYGLDFNFTPVTSCLVRNNFINVGISGQSSSNVQSGLIFDHNIIEGNLGQFSNAIFSNNIFFYSNISNWSQINNCTFTNNITASTASNILPYGTNSGGGNMNNVTFGSLFVGLISAVQGYPALTTLNWHLLSTCIGHNAGSDGTDVGIYGGTYAMQNLTGASSIIPQMTLMNINNVSIPVNGTLNVRFKAKKEQ